jgi:hypothetical protein
LVAPVIFNSSARPMETTPFIPLWVAVGTCLT